MYRSVVVQRNESGKLRLRRNEESGEGPIQGHTYSFAVGNMCPELFSGPDRSFACRSKYRVLFDIAIGDN